VAEVVSRDRDFVTVRWDRGFRRGRRDSGFLSDCRASWFTTVRAS